LVDILREEWGRPYVGLVHRLDRNTSGLMVVAKRSKAAQRLTESLKKGDLLRHYEAILMGDLSTDPNTNVFTWQNWLLKDSKTNTVRVVKEGTPGAKLAVLRGEKLGVSTISGQPISHVRFVLDTGRSHQIRVQSAYQNHPLLGDLKYGFKPFQGVDIERTLLHSTFIKFPHPVGGRAWIEFHEPLPADMKKFFKSFVKDK